MHNCACGQEFKYHDDFREHRIECASWLGDLKDPERFAALIEHVWNEGGTEYGHEDADDLMMNLLREMGYSKAVDFIKEQTRWFA